jgi:transketolase
LENIAESDERVWLVTGDLGYRVLDGFAARFATRFVNAGVAEQNLVGLAAGLALAGRQVWVYSIVNFPVMRALEQVRNDVAYHNLNVKIVTVGGGLVYGAHGYSHHGAEDLGVMRLLPNMTVMAPGDPVEAAWATSAAAKTPGPVYLRLARGGESNIHSGEGASWSLGLPISVRTGADVTLATTGGMLPVAMAVAELLAKRKRIAAVFSVPVLRPLDLETLFASARATQRLITIEDHGRGGLGTIVAERLAARPEPFQFRALHFRDQPVTVAGTNDELLARHGLSPATIAYVAFND